MRVTIILDSGGFLINPKADNTHLDVGYFETSGPHDIEVSEDGGPMQALPKPRLGNRNERIDVEHLDANGSVKTGVNQSLSFKKDILKKSELYPGSTPEFDPSQYDCILRFYSGDFESSDVRPRVFKEHRLSDDGATGNSLTTRPIANDVLVHFDLDAGEELRLRWYSGAGVWSSSSVGPGTNSVELKLLADTSLDTKYFGRALKHNGQHYRRPNPDPPPMNGNSTEPDAGD